MATRGELFQRLGLMKPLVNPVLNAAYEIEEKQIWMEDLQSSPHGQHWHVSFHASSFPGDDPKACGRAAMYSLLNIPGQEPIDRKGRAVMEAGKDIEDRIVKRFERSGVLISASPDAEIQTGYKLKEYWLTGSTDAVIRLPPKGRPHVVEVKSKDGEVVTKMQQGQKSYDDAHRSQVLTYIGLSGTEDGSILYVSRNRPSETAEFRFTHNQDFMDKGFAKLSTWKYNFLEELLPPRDTSWKWTELPCKWCKFKKVCKEDTKDEKVNGPMRLELSKSIEFAKTIREDYNYFDIRDEVLTFWDHD